MNPIVVYKPASMRSAAEIVMNSAFGYSGQRMTSCSKVIISAGEQREFTEHILAAAKKMVIGDPAEKNTFDGPVISEDNMLTFLDTIKETKDNLIFGGKRISDPVTEAGYYVMPAILTGLPRDHKLNEIDHSLPILSIQLANDLEEAIEMAADCEFGPSSGIISKDENDIGKFLRETCSDIVYVNGRSESADVAVKADVGRFMIRSP
jgi:acyl-CoA reductase-like NAD-dependent aldehyde dehydrogenase